MARRLLLQTILWWIGIALLLFLPVRTLTWWSAWIFIFESAILGLLTGFWLIKHDPELLKERLSFFIQAEQKTWDKIILSLFMLLFISWFLFMAWSVRAYGFYQVPLVLQIFGALCIAISMLIVFFTFRENSYAAPVVKIQTYRDHKVISTGLYSYVRHPMYAGALLYFVGTPLLLGSWYGLIFTLLLIFLMAVRAYEEEKTLYHELKGYREYMKKVPYRFIPYLW